MLSSLRLRLMLAAFALLGTAVAGSVGSAVLSPRPAAAQETARCAHLRAARVAFNAQIDSNKAALGPSQFARLEALRAQGNAGFDQALAQSGCTGVTGVCDSPPPPSSEATIAQPNSVTLGTAGDDVIYGTAGDDRIAGLGGNDLIFGQGGNDQITGGAGNDTICGGEGNDRVFGDAGHDVISGDAGDDHLAGGAGNDSLSGGARHKQVVGRPGYGPLRAVRHSGQPSD